MAMRQGNKKEIEANAGTPDPDVPGGPQRRQGQQNHREVETWQSVMGTDSSSSHPPGS